MKLYTSFGPNPAVVNAFLAEKNQQLPIVMLDIMKAESRQPPFLEKNPAGTTPLLELDDGTYIAESLAICEYLDEALPGASLIGRNAVERARTRMWVRRIDLSIVQPSASGWKYAEGLEFCKNFMPVIPHAADDFKSMAAQGVKWLDGQMGDNKYVCGDSLSLADIFLYVFVEFGEFSGQPRDKSLRWIAAWRDRLAAHALAKALEVRM